MSIPAITAKNYVGTADEANMMTVSYTASYEYDDGSGGAATPGTFSMTNSWLIYSNSDELTTWLASFDSSLSATVTTIESATDGLGVFGTLYADAAFDSSVSPQFTGGLSSCLFMPGQASCLSLNASTMSGIV